MDSNLEAFSRNPTDGSFEAIAFQLAAVTKSLALSLLPPSPAPALPARRPAFPAHLPLTPRPPAPP